ncbi:MAG: hypothetical protein ACI4IN_04105 [Eubacterium sp.]
MKRAAIIFCILFVITLLIPLISIVQNNKSTQTKPTNQLVTIFDTKNDKI